jgi:hypothetical protein
MLFIELRPFRRRLDDLLNDEDFRDLQSHLVNRPQAGALIRGTGGFRKIRWAESGKGKSGGVRVVYFYRPASSRIYFAAIYPKGEKDSLTKEEKNELKAVVSLLP